MRNRSRLAYARQVFVAAAAAGLALSALTLSPVLAVRAQGTCYIPDVYFHQDGDTMSDGVQPSLQVNDNECLGETPSGGASNDAYDQYVYQIGVQGHNEQDVWGQARAWVCGNLAWNQTFDQSYDVSETSPWWDYGNQDNACGIQFDWTVRVTTWDGDRWSAYQSEQSGEECPDTTTQSCAGA